MFIIKWLINIKEITVFKYVKFKKDIKILN